MLAQHKWIKPTRLTLAFLLTPVILLIWLSVSFDVATWHCGMNPDGPALIMLGLLLAAPVLLVLILGSGLGVFFVLAEDHLSFREAILPTLLVALVSGLSVYLSARPWGQSSFAPILGMLSMLGVIASALCFYFVGVWKAVGRNGKTADLVQAP